MVFCQRPPTERGRNRDLRRLHAKAGWRDASSERLAALLQQSGLGRLDRRCWTRFDFIEFDEGPHAARFSPMGTAQTRLTFRGCRYVRVKAPQSRGL